MIKKFIKHIIILIIMLTICFLPSTVNASTVSQGGYSIKEYNIDIIVNENNTFDITETIDVNFSSPRHGIFRKIPLKNEVRRIDGTYTKSRARISNIEVSEKFTKSNENGNKVLKIGNADKTVKGDHSYKIKYKYNIGKDKLNDKDEFYFNLIGPDWDTTIEKVNFKITMPKSFDKSLLGFSSGFYGTEGSSIVDFSVDGNVISGNTIETLKSHEALTVRLTLPDGYFVGASSDIDLYSIIVMIVSVVFLILSGYLWKQYGKDDKVVETVEFYPPEGYNSAEIGYIYKGNVDTKAKISLLIYLADKGYIKIKEGRKTSKEKEKAKQSKKGFTIYKIKEYDGDNSAERKFMSGLFYKNHEITEKDEEFMYLDYITDKDLKDHFYTTLNSLTHTLQNKKSRNKIFEVESDNKIVRVVFMIIVLGLLLMIPVMTDGFIVPIMYGIGGISLIGLIIFAILMPKRTKEGNKLLGRIRGFKRFLETAEKEQLEALVEKNPEYFYHILPYTYALGVSDKWIKQFETIAIEPPSWYDSPDAFDMYVFGHFLNSTMSKASSVMTSDPTSSSSGGGGGGFSGGGFGGGGGGSW